MRLLIAALLTINFFNSDCQATSGLFSFKRGSSLEDEIAKLTKSCKDDPISHANFQGSYLNLNQLRRVFEACHTIHVLNLIGTQAGDDLPGLVSLLNTVGKSVRRTYLLGNEQEVDDVLQVSDSLTATIDQVVNETRLPNRSYLRAFSSLSLKHKGSVIVLNRLNAEYEPNDQYDRLCEPLSDFSLDDL